MSFSCPAGDGQGLVERPGASDGCASRFPPALCARGGDSRALSALVGRTTLLHLWRDALPLADTRNAGVLWAVDGQSDPLLHVLALADSQALLDCNLAAVSVSVARTSADLLAPADSSKNLARLAIVRSQLHCGEVAA